MSEFYTVDKVPLIFKWVESMFTVDTIKNLAMSPESHRKFVELLKVCENQ